MEKIKPPIDHSVSAKPHTPVYRMHRYFARRPYSVFAELVNHYSEPGEVILDPFCGGGVTLVEGALQGRRVIGFDINPLASFITRMELADVELEKFRAVVKSIRDGFELINNQIFSTCCDQCEAETPATWFEYSAVTTCVFCGSEFRIFDASKKAVGTWNCVHCQKPNRFSPQANTKYELVNVFYSCVRCKHSEIRKPSNEDIFSYVKASERLVEEEKNGLWVPNAEIPDCNMQRESALFKKGIVKFRQLFTNRHLLALALLHQIIINFNSEYQDWLLLAFSSTLRYTNRMVTRNPGWRGDRPLEWAKPGYWLPPVHLEANVLTEFLRRCDAVYRGKKDYLIPLKDKVPSEACQAEQVISKQEPSFYVGNISSTSMPIPDHSVDVIITDPPYGSYVQYADLSNFWSIWLPTIDGMGHIINTEEEAVIARKSFPGAKNASDYQKILEKTFTECQRVLKENGYMVMTFHNREPRAWAALLLAVIKAGFYLPENGIIFQDGIPSYKHTAQSRRAGSVIGDFILSFRKSQLKPPAVTFYTNTVEDLNEDELVHIVRGILQKYGPLKPDALMAQFYIDVQPLIISSIQHSLSEGNGAANRLIEKFDDFQLFDSHKRQILEKYFSYSNGIWSLKE